jgi:hypothetical protein
MMLSLRYQSSAQNLPLQQIAQKRGERRLKSVKRPIPVLPRYLMLI